MFNFLARSKTGALALLVPIKTTDTSEEPEKKAQIFSAFEPEPEANIAIFFTNQKYNKQRNVKIEK